MFVRRVVKVACYDGGHENFAPTPCCFHRGCHASLPAADGAALGVFGGDGGEAL